MEGHLERMRNHLAEALAETSNDNITLRPPAVPAKYATALELVERAIQLFRDAKDEATARGTLARDAIEKLEVAETRARAADAAQQEAAARLDEVSAKLRDVEMALERTAANAAAAQTRIFAAEEQARDAEERATEAENALKRIETIIRSLISENAVGDFSGLAPAPAATPSASPSANEPHQQQQNDGPDCRVDYRGDNPDPQMDAEPRQKPAANEGTNDADRNVADQAEPMTAHEFAGESSSDKHDE